MLMIIKYKMSQNRKNETDVNFCTHIYIIRIVKYYFTRSALVDRSEDFIDCCDFLFCC